MTSYPGKVPCPSLSCSGRTLISCKHRTSGCCSQIQLRAPFLSAARRPLTFHVMSFIGNYLGKHCCAYPQDCFAYGKLHEQTGNMMNANLKSILCVEDEPEMIDLIRLILGRRGFEVKGAAGGAEGLKLIRQDPPDLVLLDLMMPDMDGWEVYQQMKADEKTKNIPVIVVTAKAQSIDKVLGLHIAKVDDYITKPFSPQDLMNSVDKVLKSKG